MILDTRVLPKDRPVLRSLSLDWQWSSYRGILILNDIGMALLASLLAFGLRFNWFVTYFNDGYPSWEYYESLTAFWVAPLWLIAFISTGMYSRQKLLGGTAEYSGVISAVSMSILALIFVTFMQPDFLVARGWLVMLWAFSILLTIFGRFMLRRVIYAARQRGYFLTPALLVGNNGEAISLAQQLLSWQTSGLALRGVVMSNPDEPYQDDSGQLPTLGAFEHLDEMIRRYRVGEIVIVSSALSREQMLSMFQQYGFRKDVNLRLSSGLFEVITTGLSVQEMAYVPLISVNRFRLNQLQQISKRTLELMIVIPAVIVLLPLWMVVAVMIKLSTGGPIFYRRHVMGSNGTQFDAYKFCSMVPNGDEVLAQHPEMKEILERTGKLKDDPRVTGIGRILRRYSIDEMLQLINILKGDMALVGPRMIAPDEMDKFGQWAMNRLTVRPGLTGLWQVSGRSDLNYEARMQLDMQYIRQWSLWLDIQIMLRTPFAVLKGKGAY